MYAASSHNALITCPFEVSHRIEASKLAGHVVKCQKNHKNVSIVTCPLNAEHKIHSSEISFHISECNGMKVYIDQKLKDPEHEKKYSVQHPVDIPTEENWDEEEVPVYNPNEYLMRNKIIRVAKVEPPKIRKEFRAEHRRHISMLKHGDPVQTTPPAELEAMKPTTSKAPTECSNPVNKVLDDFPALKVTDSNQWTKVKSSKGKNTKSKK